ncbi:uncharacterized protein si:ch211-286b5.2 [Astyanax mexicanus]|uniref:uncharacterized protein si:ch211-286b5.2 n=1 Tax=Astyanax mexicanus TaxID=7994 RepID=UPI0020CAE8B7|nr:uncharacterized protein si:ch211-286b5.2 [Astyanax mexicanus]XP_049325566.1 uncharacterized protein si:ch211-286b5.2 [Astyanax mexicanus]
MKRKAQTAEFKPPMKRFARISRRNSRENAGESAETGEIQPTDAKQISATVASSIQSAAPLGNSEEHQPQCSPQLDSDLIDLNIKHPEDAGMEEDTGPKHQTPQLRKGSLDETGDDMLVNIEEMSGAIAVPAKACEEPEPECPKSPPKKRLRRRMGMCGLGDRKRRLVNDGQQCRQSPTETKMAESTEATGKESGDVLKCIDDGSPLLKNEGTTESVFLEQNHSSLQQMMTEGASSTEQEIQDLPSETAWKIEESDLKECRTFHGMDMVSKASKIIADCLDDVEMQYGPTGHDTEDSGMAETGLPEEEYQVGEEANYGCTDLADEDSNKGSKETDEHLVEVPEKLFFGLLGVTSVTSGSSSVPGVVSDGSKSTPVDVAEKMNYSSIGTNDATEDSKVKAEQHHASTQEIHKDSTETTNKDSTQEAEDVSHGTDTVTEVCEGSREPIEHLVNEAVIFGSTSVTAVCKGSTEQIEHPVDEAVINCSNSVNKVCGGSKNPTEYAGEVAEDEKNYGSAAVTNDDCESSVEVNKLPVADRGIYGSPSDTEFCESSRKPTELTVQVTEEVTNGPIYYIKFCECSKEWTEHPVELSELESYASTAGTNEVSEDSKETIGHPPQMTEEVNCASTAITSDVSECSREQIENPNQLAKEESCGSNGVTNEVCEGSTESTELPIQLAEEVSYSSTVVTNEVSEGSTEPAGHPVEMTEALTCGFICFTEGSTEMSKHMVDVAEKKSFSAVGLGLANKACESSDELNGHSVHMTKEVISTTSYVSEVSSKQTENPFHVAEEETCGSNVTNEASEGSKGLINHLVQVDKKEIYVSAAFTNKASEDYLEPAGCTVKVGEEESYGRTVITSEVPQGSTEWTGHPAQVAENESCGSSAIPKEASEGSRESTENLVQVDVDESCGSNTVTKEASESSRESAEHAVQLAEDESYGSNTVPKEASEGSKKWTGHPPQMAKEKSNGSTAITNEVSRRFRESTKHSIKFAEYESCGSNTLPKEATEGSRESIEHSVQVDVDESCGSNTVPKEASEGSTEWTGHPALVAEDENYGSTAVANKAFVGSLELTGHPAQGVEDESYGCIAITDEVSRRFRESTKHSIKLAKDEIGDSNTVLKETSEGSKELTQHSVQVVKDEICGSNTVPKEASEGFKELTDQSVLLAKEDSYGSTAIASKAFVGSLELIGHPSQVTEEESYGSTAIANKVHEDSYKVSMEVQEALTALEDSDMELDRNPRRLQLNIQTNLEVGMCMEHSDYGLTASTEAAFSELCETGSQFEHMELTQMSNTAAEVRSTDPDGKRSSSTEGLMGHKAPPTDQEELTNDLPVTSAIAKLQPICNRNLNLAFTEFSQDHNNIPSSLCSVTDSQLNSITLGMELEDQTTLEGFVHQEDATELVCGLIKELSSLNCIVMAAHKEMEVLRRGNRPPKAPIRRSFSLRNSEI